MLVLLIIFMIAAPISSVDIEVDMPTSRIEPSQAAAASDLDFGQRRTSAASKSMS